MVRYTQKRRKNSMGHIQDKTARKWSLQLNWGDHTLLYHFGSTGEFKRNQYQDYLDELEQIPSTMSATRQKQVELLRGYFEWRALLHKLICKCPQPISL
jgi:hypothetical protein